MAKILKSARLPRRPAARVYLPSAAINSAPWPGCLRAEPIELPPAAIAPSFRVTRALAVRQPFAWLICRGYKTIENRTWPTDFRGRIAIYASQQPAEGVDAAKIFSALRTDLGLPPMSPMKAAEFEPGDILALGAIVGTVEVADCFAFSGVPAVDFASDDDLDAAAERLYAENKNCRHVDSLVSAPHIWATDPHCFLLQRAEFFREAIACEGRLNLFHLPPEVAQRVNAARKTAILPADGTA